MPFEIDDKFLNVDFSKQPEFVFGDLGGQCFGSAYESIEELIPRNQWEAEAEKLEATKTGLEWLITRIFDQDGEGACVSDMTAQAHEVLQAAQYGKENVIHLSAISLYKRIGRSAQSGAMLSDALEEMRSRGILPLDTPENRTKFGEHVMPNIGFNRRFPDGWESTAAKFKSHEAHVVQSVEGLVTALLKGHPVGVGRQGHSIVYVGIRFKSGKMYCPYANSWRLDWGQPMGDMTGGFGVDSESQIRQSSSWAIAWRSATVPS